MLRATCGTTKAPPLRRWSRSSGAPSNERLAFLRARAIVVTMSANGVGGGPRGVVDATAADVSGETRPVAVTGSVVWAVCKVEVYIFANRQRAARRLPYIIWICIVKFYRFTNTNRLLNCTWLRMHCTCSLEKSTGGVKLTTGLGCCPKI